MPLIDRFLGGAVKRGRLTVVHPDGSRATFGSSDPDFPDVTIRFADRGAERAILSNPALGAGEMFTHGRLAVDEGEVWDLVRMLKASNAWEAGGGALKSGAGRALARARYRVDRFNWRRRSRRNVAHHYDLSADFYRLFLDEDLQYSCAYFTDPGVSLEQAQADKKAHIAAKLLLEPGMRVLDIGCGWGGLALYLHRKTGAEVLGVTLSTEQLAVARSRAEAAGVADKVRFELRDYRDVSDRFDRIVSVGMFEHVGPPHYRRFFAKCRDLLTDDGAMLLHTIGRMGKPGVTDAWTAKYIFPGGYNPALSEIVRAYEGLRLFPTDVEVLRLHYAWTIRHWYARAVAARDRIVAMYDERFWRMWIFYLAGAAAAFEFGGLCNYQLQLARGRRVVPVVRDYVGEAELRLR
ncbi:SAM-dependent methyltransferase [Sphingomonas lenta]|uniref:SAM-dependent methyltransferase n=1 Tax=Sphingomonas lenta TaxID=1141887 RepID=A0A2A2SF06_9SPHN|nr:cyclopropane-fatty-acyl-phospholipid synthase family protein [Sphingomonas lenta]PAX07591.1 SAM-dependent methyltransferase [Sphingomonas lenta]